jgi:hypothetical protein
MTSQTNTIVVSVCACAARLRANAGSKFVGMLTAFP